jgi:hypothetical protein
MDIAKEHVTSMNRDTHVLIGNARKDINGRKLKKKI